MKNFKIHASNQANCNRIAGNLSAGLLLYRIFVRSKNSKMMDDTNEIGWAVLTPNEWVTDTGLSRNQYNRALRLLKDKDLIIYKNRRRGKGSGAPPLWVKISDEIQEIIQEFQYHYRYRINITTDTGTGVSNITSDIGTYNTVNKSNNVNIDCKSEKSDGTVDSNIIILGEERMKKGAGKGKEILDYKTSKTFKDVINKQRGKKRSNKITGVQSFEFLWINLHGERYDDKIERWTGKEQGYAKTIITKANGRKRFNLVEAINAVVGNWEDYADYASTQRGQDKGPFFPSIGYIAAGFQDLVYWYKEYTKTVHSSAKDDDMMTVEEALKEKE